ncbi:MAG: serine hydrolase [Proteobacteria bacterium]|nr:serine hydrolase [Pseudomonadota bacterium]
MKGPKVTTATPPAVRRLSALLGAGGSSRASGASSVPISTGASVSRFAFRTSECVVFSRRVAESVEVSRSARSLGAIPWIGVVPAYPVKNGIRIIKNGRILYERYGLGNTEDSRWVSFSVAKSVVAMLIGAAIQDGYIASVNEKVTQYLPRLKGSSYDQSSIANLMQMASGVQWNEDYADPKSDVNTASWETIKLYDFLRNKPRNAESGEAFNYNTAETNLAGTLLRSAVGNNLSTYLSEKIWQPFGMESDASWNLTEPGGGEFGGCCINATLRDYGRIGLFALANGRLADGTEVLPPTWMQESTAPSESYDGYGYFWWLYGQGTYAALGIFGQTIYVDHNEDLVIAIHSARPLADDEIDWAWDEALFEAIAGAIRE